METIRKNDVGTIINLSVTEGDVAVDLTSATALQMLFQRPDMTEFARTATVAVVDAETVIRYILAAGDINMKGNWTLQGRFTLGTWTGTTSPVTLKVEEVIEG
jgi:hypothetical protein